MEVSADEGFDDEGPFSPWVPPDDRLWRHPSETSVGSGLRSFAAGGSRGYLSRTWTTALIAGMIGALLASGIGVATGTFTRTTVVHTYSSPAPATTRLTETVAVPDPSWSNIDSNLAPSMVMITGNADAGEVTASGMLWEQAWGTSYILAADDALGGVSSVSVAMAGGRTGRGRVIGTDPQTGIAVISVADSSLPKNLSPSFPQLGPLTDVHVGDEVAAMGSGASTAGSFVPGAVSSLDRPVTDSTDGLVMVGMIAVATIGPVNYGTAVVDTSGEVVGMTVEGGPTDGNSDLVSYAVPMDVASAIATQIIDGEHPWHPWIGVLQAEDLLPSTAAQMNLTGGAEVDAISPNSPAAKAGLGPNDVIVSLGSTTVDSTGALLDALSGCRNSRVALRYLHQGKPVNTSIQVIAQPANP